MVTVEIRKGDTVQLDLDIKSDGQQFVPDKEKIVFSVGRFGKKEFSVEAENSIVLLPHSLTNALSIGTYDFDVRVYDANKALVATPIIGRFSVLGVVNDDLV